MKRTFQSVLLLFLVANIASVALSFEDGLNDVAEDDHEIERQMDDYDDGVARACKDSLPNKMTSNSNCKKLKKTCAKLKSKCSSKLGNALGSSNNAAKCKTALGSKKNTKVKVYCPLTCGTCANGAWSSFGSYTSCTVTCGGGLKYRSRTCTNPSPSGGGSSCSGSSTQSASCNSDPCPATVGTDGSWMAWEEWTPCSVSCFNGTTSGIRTRERNCTEPLSGGLTCTALNSTSNYTETEVCNQDVLCQTCFQEFMAGGIDLVVAKIEEVALKIAALEAAHENNTATISMNEKRHQNTDNTFQGLCPLIDTIFDTTDAPGAVQYDCCHESFTGTTGQIGNAMVCLTETLLSQTSPPPFSTTDRGRCDTTCGSFPEELVAGYSANK